MSSILVEKIATPCTSTALYTAMEQAWAKLILDTAVSRKAILIFLSQWALETGWGKSCWNNNLGNAKHVDNDGHDFFQMPCWEVVNGQKVTITPPNPGCRFLAFETLEAGTEYYLTQLRGRWRAAWPYALAGDPVGFGHALKVQGYYSASEADYERDLESIMHTLDAKIPEDPADRETNPELPDTGPSIPPTA